MAGDFLANYFNNKGMTEYVNFPWLYNVEYSGIQEPVTTIIYDACEYAEHNKFADNISYYITMVVPVQSLPDNWNPYRINGQYVSPNMKDRRFLSTDCDSSGNTKLSIEDCYLYFNGIPTKNNNSYTIDATFSMIDSYQFGPFDNFSLCTTNSKLLYLEYCGLVKRFLTKSVNGTVKVKWDKYHKYSLQYNWFNCFYNPLFLTALPPINGYPWGTSSNTVAKWSESPINVQIVSQ
jgi:hypothetical protein